MTESKTLIGLTLALVTALLAGGLFYPDSFMMNLAGTDVLSTYVRAVIVVLLVVLLVTKPPRSQMVRTVIGAWAVILAVSSLQLLLNYQLRLLDAVIFMEVAIIFAIEALETKTTIPVRQKETPAKKIPVLSL